MGPTRAALAVSDASESQALEWLDRAMAQPAGTREPWLRARGLPGVLVERVLRLLRADADADAGDFLETGPTPAPLEPPSLPRIGERLGAYQLLRLLDAGGMGVVYLARRADDVYQQQVAVKLIQPAHLAGTAQQRRQLIARFEAERSILAQLQHANVARILDGGSTDSGIPYLVMEYVDGIAVTDYCDRERLGVGDRLRLFVKVCDGVQEAHRNLIVHRDLKPANILVDADGEPRLLDFGIAKLLEQRTGDASAPANALTALTAMTPAYASPEQVRHQPITTGSDVYSLGVLLYQLLAGVRPYELSGLSPAEAERRICESAVEPLRRALANAPLSPAERARRQAAIGSDLERIVAKALHKDAACRYGSAQAFADDLHRCLDGRPVSAQADTVAYRMRRFLGRHRLASAAVILALVSILGTAGIALWQAQQARRAVADTGEINQFLIEVLDASDAYSAGSELSLNEALDDASARIDARFGDRPELAAGIRLAIGNSLVSHNRLDDAQAQLERGLAESRRAHGDRHLQTLRLRSSIALLRFYQGHPAEAIALFEQVLTQLAANGQQRDPFHANVLNDLAYVYLAQEDYGLAHRYSERAVAAFENQGVDVAAMDRSAMLANLAHALDGLGQPQAAVAPYERASIILEELFPQGSPNSAILLNNRALLARSLGDPEQSLSLMQESSAMRQRLFKDGHPLIVRGLTNVARQALELGQGELALRSAGEAVAAAEQTFDRPHGYHVRALATLAEALAQLDRYAEAADRLRKAEAMLAALDEPVASIVDSLADIRASLCVQPAAGIDCADTAPALP